MGRTLTFALLVPVLVAVGCRSTPVSPVAALSHPELGRRQPDSPPVSSARNPHSKSRVAPVAFQEPLPKAVENGATSEPEIPKASAEEVEPAGELRLQDFVADVVAKYPSIEAMMAAYQAAAQRYPQAIALDDPMLMAMTAPESLNSAVAEGAYALELRQKLPWFGKRALRGEVAAEEAAAAGHEVQDARLKVALVAQTAYIEYYLADRQLELNKKSSGLANEFLEIAQVRFRTNQVTQQDVLQAELELAELSRRKLELQRMRRVATARMNTLLLQPPNLQLPSPQLDAEDYQIPSDPSLLYEWAQRNRPDLAAQAHQVEAENANLALAYKQYYPDGEFFGRYDTFWQPSSTQGDLRGQVGVAVNLPVYRGKLNAAVCEAKFRLQRERAEYEQLVAEIQLEVQTALEQVRESEQAVQLYEQRILPAAEQYLDAVRSNYEVGKATSLDFVQAQRELLKVREQQLMSRSTLAQRMVELERNVGGSLPRDLP